MAAFISPTPFSDAKMEHAFRAKAFASALPVTISIGFLTAVNAGMVSSLLDLPEFTVSQTQRENMKACSQLMTTLFVICMSVLWCTKRQFPRERAHTVFAHAGCAVHIAMVAAELITGAPAYTSSLVQRLVPLEIRATLYITAVHLNAAPPLHHAIHALIVALSLLRSVTVDELWGGSSRTVRLAAARTLLQAAAIELLGCGIQRMLRDMFLATGSLSPTSPTSPTSPAHSAAALRADALAPLVSAAGASSAAGGVPPPPSADRHSLASLIGKPLERRWPATLWSTNPTNPSSRWSSRAPSDPSTVSSPLDDSSDSSLRDVRLPPTGLDLLRLPHTKQQDNFPLHSVQLKFADEAIELEYTAMRFRDACA